MLEKMVLSEVFRALERASFDDAVGSVSIGGLRTYQIYESFKIHARLNKLNRERLRKAIPRLWSRVEAGDEDLAREVAQAVLVSNLSMVIEILDFLGVPHDGSGFFQKNDEAAGCLGEGWRERVYAEFREKYPETRVLLYINHLDWELGKPAAPFLGSK